LKSSKANAPTKQQRDIKKGKLQHRLKENKTLNSKQIKMNQKKNRDRNLLEHFDFNCEIRL
jgi:hypothetical protein